MSSTFTVRVDEHTEHELSVLVDRGRSRNAVISDAIHRAYRQLVLDQVRTETEVLAADADDLAEVREIQTDLDDLRAW